ncbi:barstar family protein [Streptomyces sp. NPDC026672]|uniref:barstar family protein n=1 Tax=unclassified Streptomyces TaxID=2593676 RepID=UPI0033E08A33
MSDDLAGLHTVALDLHGVTDKAGLMDRCAGALGLPDWFGRNWDALADSLSDPTVWPAGAAVEGLLLVVTGWRDFARERPEEWAVAEEVLTGAQGGEPRLVVALALE